MIFRSTLLLPFALLVGASSFAVRADEAAPICTDRPTKANGTCTVPDGSWQLETDIGNFTRDARTGSSTDTLYYINPYLKYGIGAHTDIEVNWAPSIRLRTRAGGESHTGHGAGDLYLRLKTSL